MCKQSRSCWGVTNDLWHDPFTCALKGTWHALCKALAEGLPVTGLSSALSVDSEISMSVWRCSGVSTNMRALTEESHLILCLRCVNKQVTTLLLSILHQSLLHKSEKRPTFLVFLCHLKIPLLDATLVYFL